MYFVKFNLRTYNTVVLEKSQYHENKYDKESRPYET